MVSDSCRIGVLEEGRSSFGSHTLFLEVKKSCVSRVTDIGIMFTEGGKGDKGSIHLPDASTVFEMEDAMA